MGTSLSGLTPATTFDGLLKTGDNNPIGASLKTLSDGSGNDLPIEASTTTINFTNGLTKGGVDVATIDDVTPPAGSEGQIQFNESSAFGADSNLYWDNTNKRLGVGVASPTARLQVKGSGATSATTSLLVQNSAGSELFKVQDDGAIDFGLAGLEMVGLSDGGTLRSVSNREINIKQTTTEYSTFAAHKFETWDGAAYSEIMRITGNNDQFVGIGETTPTARLQVKGSGNTSATTALLVQNSAGTDTFKVLDDGTLVAPNLPTSATGLPTGAIWNDSGTLKIA